MSKSEEIENTLAPKIEYTEGKYLVIKCKNMKKTTILSLRLTNSFSHQMRKNNRKPLKEFKR
jgi:hypothetical protein